MKPLGPALLALLLGCGEVAPIGRPPASDQFLTQERFAGLAAAGTSREAVLQRLGEPFATSPEGRALAYRRTETVDRRILTLAIIVPFWSASKVTYFQVQGLWFDGEGKLIQARLWEGHDGPHGGNPYQAYGVPTREHALLWLEKQGPGKGR